jgi:site-specific recombinase XerD
VLGVDRGADEPSTGFGPRGIERALSTLRPHQRPSVQKRDYYETERRRVAGHFAPYLDPFVQQLCSSGYSPHVRSKYLSGFVHLAVWCGRVRIRPQELSEDVVDRFDRHARACKCRPLRLGRPRCGTRSEPGARVARVVLRVLRSIGIARPKAQPHLPPLIAAYTDWLRERGLAESTSLQLLRWSGLLLRSLGNDPRCYRPADLRRFVAVQCRDRGYEVRTGQFVVSCIRAFLRYLVIVGLSDPSLLDALPRIAHWRRASHPRYVSPVQVERTIATPSTTTPVGLRDRAALLLLARLGVRAGEVVRLTLADIDWAKRRIRIISGKSREAAWLPLPSDVAQALRAYIRKGRPATTDARVFVRTKAPFVGGDRPSMIVHLVVKALKLAEVDAPIRGAHVFRHSLATGLLRNGWSLQAIGALLRHRHPETTALYAKVDFTALRLVVQPWPKDRPN